jgi:hypothetical protein
VFNIAFTPSASEPGTHEAVVSPKLATWVISVIKAVAVSSTFPWVSELPHRVPRVYISARLTLPGITLRALVLARLRSTLPGAAPDEVQAELATFIKVQAVGFNPVGDWVKKAWIVM